MTGRRILLLQLLDTAHLSRTAAFIVTLQCYKGQVKGIDPAMVGPYLRTPSDWIGGICYADAQ